MPLKDVLLHVATYPESPSVEAIEQAVGFAALVGSSLTAVATEVELKTPANALAGLVVGLNRVAVEVERASASASEVSLRALEAKAQAAGVVASALRNKLPLHAVAQAVARQARTRDLCLAPINRRESDYRSVPEALIFDSGRPVLVFQAGQLLPTKQLGSVILAWDGSRSAARAMADALPLLYMATRVQVVTVLNEKPDTVAGVGDDAVRHLKMHGIDAELNEVDRQGQLIGKVLEACILESQPDLLVMGAYGRSRIKEFVLGGATAHVLRDPRVPVLLSH